MERDHFKERLPKENRAGVANWFLMAIRSGISDPKAITDRVSNSCLGRSRQATIDAIAIIVQTSSSPPPPNAALPSDGVLQGNIPSLAEQVLDKARQAANGPQFMQLWEGNHEAYFASRNVTDKSHSEADAGCCAPVHQLP